MVMTRFGCYLPLRRFYEKESNLYLLQMKNDARKSAKLMRHHFQEWDSRVPMLLEANLSTINNIRRQVPLLQMTMSQK